MESILEINFEKRDNVSCGESPYQQYNTIEKAKSACDADAGCNGVYDKKCDNDGPFELCPKNSDRIASVVKSCVWEKTHSTGKYHLFFILMYEFTPRETAWIVRIMNVIIVWIFL